MEQEGLGGQNKSFEEDLIDLGEFVEQMVDFDSVFPNDNGRDRIEQSRKELEQLSAQNQPRREKNGMPQSESEWKVFLDCWWSSVATGCGPNYKRCESCRTKFYADRKSDKDSEFFRKLLLRPPRHQKRKIEQAGLRELNGEIRPSIKNRISYEPVSISMGNNPPNRVFLNQNSNPAQSPSNRGSVNFSPNRNSFDQFPNRQFPPPNLHQNPIDVINRLQSELQNKDLLINVLQQQIAKLKEERRPDWVLPFRRLAREGKRRRANIFKRDLLWNFALVDDPNKRLAVSDYENIRDGFLYFFKHEKKILQDIVESCDNGLFFKKLQQSFYDEIPILPPSVGLAIKLRFGLSQKKYEALSLQMRKEWNLDREKWEFRRSDDIRFPQIFPSLASVLLEQERLATIQRMWTDVNRTGARISIREILSSVLSEKSFTDNLVLEKNNTIQLKIGFDAYRMSRSRVTTNLYLGFLGLKNLVHSPDYTFPVAMYQGKDNRINMEIHLKDVAAEIDELITNGIVIQQRPKYTIEFFFCSDYPATLAWLGLNDSKSNQFCVWCKIHRDHICEFSKRMSPRKPGVNFENWLGNGAIKMPLTTKIPLENFMICNLHMFLKIFERIMGKFYSIAHDQNTKEACDTWFSGKHMHITFTGKKASVKCIGREMVVFLQHRDQFYSVVKGVNEDTKDLLNRFAALYKISQQTVVADAVIKDYAKKAKEYLNVMKTVLSSANIKNYEHILLFHAPSILTKHKTLAKFSTQCWEHCNKRTKKDFQTATNKGGGRYQNSITGNWICQLLALWWIRFQLRIRPDLHAVLPFELSKDFRSLLEEAE